MRRRCGAQQLDGDAGAVAARGRSGDAMHARTNMVPQHNATDERPACSLCRSGGMRACKQRQHSRSGPERWQAKVAVRVCARASPLGGQSILSLFCPAIRPCRRRFSKRLEGGAGAATTCKHLWPGRAEAGVWQAQPVLARQVSSKGSSDSAAAVFSPWRAAPDCWPPAPGRRADRSAAHSPLVDYGCNQQCFS